MKQTEEERKKAIAFFNQFNDNMMIKWGGLSDGGKWTRGIQIAQEHASNELASYKAELREKESEAIKIVGLLAEWSLAYPRGRVYPMGKMSMDDELVVIEERAKKLFKALLEDNPTQSKCTFCGKPKRMDGHGTIELLCECD